MAASFIGLSVQIKLRPQSSASPQAYSCQGCVASVDAVHGTIELEGAVVSYNPSNDDDDEDVSEQQYVGRKLLKREDVLGLEVVGGLSQNRQQQSEPAAAPRTSRRVSQARGTSQQNVHPDGRQLQQPDASYVSASGTGNGASPASVGQSASPRPTRKTQKNVQANASATGPASRRAKEVREIEQHPGYTPSPPPAVPPTMDDDFDFSAGLASFDKRRVWDHIRSQDSTDPAERLVSHNRRTGTPGGSASQAKLLPTESVLSSRELEMQEGEQDQALEQLAMGNGQRHGGGGGAGAGGSYESDYEHDAPVDDAIAVDDGANAQVGTFTTRDGIALPAIKYADWRALMQHAEHGLPQRTRVTLAARGIASYVLNQVLGSQSLFAEPELARPRVAIICSVQSFVRVEAGLDKTLAALLAGAKLVQWGVDVDAWIPSSQQLERYHGTDRVEMVPGLREVLQEFMTSGGSFVKDKETLDRHYDLLIDVLDEDATDVPSDAIEFAKVLAAQQKVVNMIYADNSSNRPPQTLAINSPAGTNHDTGASLLNHPSEPIRAPNHLIALGALRPCTRTCVERGTRHVALVDIGIQPVLMQRFGSVEEWDQRTFAGEDVQLCSWT